MRGLLVLFVAAAAGAQPAPEPRPVEDARLPWRMGSFACIGAGVAALAFGALSFGKGIDYENQVSDAEKDAAGVITGLTQREAFRLQTSAEESKGLGALAFGAGGLLLISGVVLYILEPPPSLMTPLAPEPEVRPFSLLPTVGPDGAGLAARATF